MKLKEILFGLGLKPPPKEYPFALDTIVLPLTGEIRYARWLHPKERRKEFTQGMVEAYRDFLRPGDAALDIGAHTGDTTLPMALAAGPQGLVFALEPNPYAFKVLLANAALNRRKTNIHPLMFAATPEDGTFEFGYSDSGYCNGGLHPGIRPWQHAHFFKLRVAGRNLVRHLRREYPDDWRRIRFIKTDTEGHDHQVVLSLRELLMANRPFLRSEIYRHRSAEERIAFYRDLRDLGYRVHRYGHDEAFVGPELAPRELMNWPHFDVFAIPDEASGR